MANRTKASEQLSEFDRTKKVCEVMLVALLTQYLSGAAAKRVLAYGFPTEAAQKISSSPKLK